MKFYKHWARASKTIEGFGQLHRWGYSDRNHDDALALARTLIASSEAPDRSDNHLEGYPYSDRPLREEIVNEIHHGDHLIALISRNAYGCLVLNTTGVLFADIDSPASTFKPVGLLGRIFGKKAPVVARSRIIDSVNDFVQSSPGLGLRLYKTAAGYRALITSRTYEPTSEESFNLLRGLNSDPLYIKLCKVQECFRARISPKYWRCDAHQPPHRFPWIDESQELAMREWETAYHQQADQYATCRLIDTFGTTSIARTVEPIIQLHDDLCCVDAANLA